MHFVLLLNCGQFQFGGTDEKKKLVGANGHFLNPIWESPFTLAAPDLTVQCTQNDHEDYIVIFA